MILSPPQFRLKRAGPFKCGSDAQHRRAKRCRASLATAAQTAAVMLATFSVRAQTNENLTPLPSHTGTTHSVTLTPPALPDFGIALLNVLGGLAIVLAIFLGAMWLFRNWQRLTMQRGGRAPRLNVVEVRSLGGRHALYVVAYEQERFLLAGSPTGVSLLSHLPQADAAAADAQPAQAAPTPSSFAGTLAQMLKGPGR